jgi:hypothetical protein
MGGGEVHVHACMCTHDLKLKGNNVKFMDVIECSMPFPSQIMAGWTHIH